MKKVLLIMVVAMYLTLVGCNSKEIETTTTEVETTEEPVVEKIAIWGHENIYDVEILDVNDSMVTFDINGQIVVSTDPEDIRVCQNHEGKTCLVNVALVGDADDDTWSRYEFRSRNGVLYINVD